jgi:hypothetical protein
LRVIDELETLSSVLEGVDRSRLFWIPEWKRMFWRAIACVEVVVR